MKNTAKEGGRFHISRGEESVKEEYEVEKKQKIYRRKVALILAFSVFMGGVAVIFSAYGLYDVFRTIKSREFVVSYALAIVSITIVHVVGVALALYNSPLSKHRRRVQAEEEKAFIKDEEDRIEGFIFNFDRSVSYLEKCKDEFEEIVSRELDTKLRLQQLFSSSVLYSKAISLAKAEYVVLENISGDAFESVKVLQGDLDIVLKQYEKLLLLEERECVRWRSTAKEMRLEAESVIRLRNEMEEKSEHHEASLVKMRGAYYSLQDASKNKEEKEKTGGTEVCSDEDEEYKQLLATYSELQVVCEVEAKSLKEEKYFLANREENLTTLEAEEKKEKEILEKIRDRLKKLEEDIDRRENALDDGRECLNKATRDAITEGKRLSQRLLDLRNIGESCAALIEDWHNLKDSRRTAEDDINTANNKMEKCKEKLINAIEGLSDHVVRKSKYLSGVLQESFSEYKSRRSVESMSRILDDSRNDEYGERMLSLKEVALSQCGIEIPSNSKRG